MFSEEEIDRRCLLAQQKEQRLKKAGTSGGNGHDKEESETPIAEDGIKAISRTTQ